MTCGSLQATQFRVLMFRSDQIRPLLALMHLIGADTMQHKHMR